MNSKFDLVARILQLWLRNDFDEALLQRLRELAATDGASAYPTGRSSEEELIWNTRLSSTPALARILCVKS